MFFCFNTLTKKTLKIMTLKNVSDLFENLIDETSKKSEIKIYQEFIQIITSLENKDLSENEIKSIETELDRMKLDSNSLNRRKYYKKQKHFALTSCSIKKCDSSLCSSRS